MWSFERCKACPTDAEGEVVLLAQNPLQSMFTTDDLLYQGFGYSLKLIGLTIRPGWDEKTLPLSIAVVDIRDPDGILIDSCSVHDFQFYVSNAPEAHSFISSTTVVIRNSHFFGFKGHDTALTYNNPLGIIAVSHNLALENTLVENNIVRYRFMYGGLFATANLTAQGSIFRHNSGYAQFGYGLIFTWSSTAIAASGVIRNSSFYNNSLLPDMFPSNTSQEDSFTYNPSDTSKYSSLALLANSTTAGCVFYAANTRGFRLTILNSTFHKNVATLGGVLTVQDTPAFSPQFFAYWLPTAPFSVSIDSSTFDSNAVVAHGIGSAISINAGSTTEAITQISSACSLHVTNSVFINNLAPSLANRLIISPKTPHTGIVSENPSMIDLHFVGRVYFSNVTVTADKVASNEYGLNLTSHIAIRYSELAFLDGIYINGLIPCFGDCGLILLHSVPVSQIQNIRVLPPSNPDPSPYASSDSYQIIRIHRQDELESQTRFVAFVRSLFVANWSSSFPLNILSIQGIYSLSMAEIQFYNISSASIQSLIRLSDIRSAIRLENSTFSNITSLIQITEAPINLLLNNVSISHFNNPIFPAISCENTLAVDIGNFALTDSHGTGLSFAGSESQINILASKFIRVTTFEVDSSQGGAAFVFRSTSNSASTNSAIRFTDSIFEENRALSGAAIFINSNANVLILNSNFSSNKADGGDGGAVSLQTPFSGSLSVQHCQYDSNTAHLGGAISFSGDLVVNNSIFVWNSARSSGGAINFPETFTSENIRVGIYNSSFRASQAPFGAAIAASNVRGHFDICDCTFSENRFLGKMQETLTKGGAIYADQGLMIQRTTFVNNAAGQGGAIFLLQQDPTPLKLINCSFADNHAWTTGGGIFVLSAETTPVLCNSHFENVSFINNTADLRGGGLAFFKTFPDFENATDLLFEENDAPRGAAIYVEQSPDPIRLGPSSFINNNAKCCGAIIFYGNISSLAVGGAVPLGVNFSDLLHNLALPDRAATELISHGNFINQGNNASWGIERATSNLDLTATLLESSIPYPDFIDPSISHKKKVYVVYPGAPRQLLVSGTDQFGQTAIGVSSTLSFAYRFLCTSSPAICSNVSFSATEEAIGRSAASKLGDETALVLTQVGFRLRPGNSAMIPEPISGVIEIRAYWDAASSDQIPENSPAPTLLNILIKGCGMGFGETNTSSSPPIASRSLPALLDQRRCAACPLYYYSLNGTCARCAYDYGVQSCSGADIISPATWWILKDVRMNRYQSVRCAESYCGVGNNCLLGRAGTMCGDCISGRNQSITSLCLDCNGPNWGMIVLVLLGLWIGVLILHSLLAASSGKATILIFFVQSAWSIRSQIPVVSVSASNFITSHPALYRFISWLLCLWPMNYLQRTILIAIVPFIMMIQLSLTFGIYHLCIRTKAKLFGSTTNISLMPLEDKNYTTLLDENGEDSEDEEGFGSEDAMLQLKKGYQSVNQSEDGFVTDLSESSDAGSSTSDSERLLSDFEVESAAMEDIGTLEVANARREAFLYQDTYQYHLQNAYFHHYRLIRTLLSLFANTYSSILGIITSTIGCIELIDGQKVLVAAPAISCNSSQFKLIHKLYAVLIPWLVIIMVTIGAKLIQAYRSRSLSATDIRFGAWYEMYKPRVFAWKLTEFVRRTLLSTIGNLLIAQPSLRATMICLMMLLSLTVQLAVRPYRHRLQNSLETLAICSLILISLLVLWQAKDPEDTKWPGLLSLALMIITAIIVASSFASRPIIMWYRRCRGKSTH